MIKSFAPTSVAAAATTSNILAGTTLEFVLGKVVRMGILAESALGDMLLTIINGNEVVCQDDPVPGGTSGKIQDPYDFHYEFVGKGRIQVILRNTNVAAKTYWGQVKVL